MTEYPFLNDPTSIVFGTAAGITAFIYFVRFVRRMFYAEKRETSIDLASQSLFENLRLENERMAKQLSDMSLQLNLLAKENHDLNMKVTELSLNVRKLVTLEKENTYLQEELSRKDEMIKELTSELTGLTESALSMVGRNSGKHNKRSSDPQDK